MWTPSMKLTPQLRYYFRTPAPCPDSDAELLTRFVTLQDQDAFAQIVSRHGAAILATCHRITGNRDDADDAFQDMFMVLIRKAAKVIPQAQVGNWLYGVARTTAQRARVAGAKRRMKERPVAAPPEPPAPLPPPAEGPPKVPIPGPPACPSCALPPAPPLPPACATRVLAESVTTLARLRRAMLEPPAPPKAAAA